MKALVAYASAHGSTAEIAAFIQRTLAAYGVDATLASAETVEAVWEYDLLIFGSAVHDGMYLHGMSQLLERCKADVAKKPFYFFITCIRALEDDGAQYARSEYVHTPTMKALGVRDIAVFAGKLDISTISWNERWLLASRYDGSEMSKHLNHDYRDWGKIGAWVHHLLKELGVSPTFSAL